MYSFTILLASEPNLLKMRLKQSVIERKARICGPSVGNRRHERLLLAAQRRQQKQQTTALSSTYAKQQQLIPLSQLTTQLIRLVES